MLQWVPNVHTYTQHRSWANRRWTYVGSVFDEFLSTLSERRFDGDTVRVLVTTGTAEEFPFTRLLTNLVPLLDEHGPLATALGVRVHTRWQTGCSEVAQLPITPEPYLPMHELRSALVEADLVISHAGAGSALAALEAGRFPVLVNRVASFGEASDDHQRELVGELAARALGVGAEADTVTVDKLLYALSRNVTRQHQPVRLDLR